MAEIQIPSNSPFWQGQAVDYPAYEVASQDFTANVGSEFRVPNLGEKLRSSKETLYIDADVHESIGLGDFAIRSMTFQLRPEWFEGRMDSTHQVFFGELQIESDTQNNGGNQLTDIPVAVKPYHIAARLAVHEYAAYRFISQSTRIPTLRPLGLWTDENKRAYLLTEFRPDLVTLDNVDWHKTGDNMLKEHFSLFDAFRSSAMILGWLHGNGFAHRDAQIKNMAIEGEGIRLIDLEQFRRAVDIREPDEDALRQAVYTDLKDLIQSVLKRGYLRTDKPVNLQAMVKMSFLDPHGSVIRHPANPVNATTGNIDDIVQDVQDELLGYV